MNQGKSMPDSEVVELKGLVDVQDGAVVSRTLIAKSVGTVTLFAFDEGQGLSEHTAPYDALVHVVEGEAALTLGGKDMTVGEGEMVLMPAGVPHSLEAKTAFKMVLTMIRA